MYIVHVHVLHVNVCIYMCIFIRICMHTVVPRCPIPSLSSRQPLQAIALSLDDKLERLQQEQGGAEEHVRGGGRGKEDSNEAISEMLDKMILQQSVERETERHNK